MTLIAYGPLEYVQGLSAAAACDESPKHHLGWKMGEKRDRTLGRAARLRRIEQLLYRTPEGMSAAELAARCGVHRTTIYHDIQSLSERMDVPIWEGEGRFGLDRTRYLVPVRLNLHEALALYIAARLLTHHSDEQNPHVVSALEKLATATPSPVQEHIARAAGLVQQRGTGSHYVAILETLALAWAERRRVRLIYRSATSEAGRERDFDVYFVEPSAIGYACYCIGLDHLHGALRTLKIERIKHAELLGAQMVRGRGCIVVLGPKTGKIAGLRSKKLRKRWPFSRKNRFAKTEPVGTGSNARISSHNALRTPATLSCQGQCVFLGQNEVGFKVTIRW